MGCPVVKGNSLNKVLSRNAVKLTRLPEHVLHEFDLNKIITSGHQAIARINAEIAQLINYTTKANRVSDI